MINNTFVIGGCRSGKSSVALEMANRISKEKKIFIATSVPRDAEMENRVLKHRSERGPEWRTAEVPVGIPESILTFSSRSNVIIVDCLTLWVSNLMENHFSEKDVFRMTRSLASSLKLSSCPVILVSNEVGAGIVPENTISRQFRDLTGWVNQRIASCVDQVIYTVAGIPLTIKPKGKDAP